MAESTRSDASRNTFRQHIEKYSRHALAWGAHPRAGTRNRHTPPSHPDGAAVCRSAMEAAWSCQAARMARPGHVEHLPFVWHEAPSDTRSHPDEPSPIIIVSGLSSSRPEICPSPAPRINGQA